MCEAVAVLMVSGLILGAETPPPADFLHDAADSTARAAMIDGPNNYEASLASSPGGLWVAYLEFVPGKGDVIRVRTPEGELQRLSEPGQYVAPTLTAEAGGGLWLTWEALVDGQWEVMARYRKPGGRFAAPRRISTASGPDISHRAAADPAGGIWIVWQADLGGHFEVIARRVTAERLEDPFVVSRFDQVADSTNPPSKTQGRQASHWRPDVTVARDGTVYVVWDAFDGRSFNVYARGLRHGQWSSALIEVAFTPAFEGRARLAPAPDGRAWVAWEEGEENWGAPYLARKRDGKLVDTWLTDGYGSVHRFRRVRFGSLEYQPGQVLPRCPEMGTELPMPAFEVMRARPNVRDGAKDVGTFYERPEIAVDAQQRLWVLYRHYYGPYIGVAPHHHVEPAWGVYARCLTGEGWSPLQRMNVDQRDGMQRLHVIPHGDGVAAIWTTGRTDRRPDPQPRGLAQATLRASAPGPAKVSMAAHLSATPPGLLIYRPPAAAPAVDSAGRRSVPLLGDLHRHTDLSLCYVPIEGTMDDAYRYAIDVARLDFLGITDHTHDLVMGDALSQVWWRSIKEVTRHELRPHFFPLFAYERSRGDTDHNVISLRDDMLRPHTYPLPQFWKELDDDTFTIAHQPVNARTWQRQDDARRPLIEVYQGFRSQSVLGDAHEGLKRGYLLGFIASSDHISTSTSYAGVWAPERKRESIFRALQARHTFGATDRIILRLESDQAMQGDVIEASAFPQLRLRVTGTAPIDRVEVVLDARVIETLPGGDRSIDRAYQPPEVSAGLHYVYVHVRQSDGNEAWSSPLWVRAGE